MKKISAILVTLTLVLGLATGCSSRAESVAETASIKQIVTDYEIVNDDETIDAFESMDVTNTKSHSCKFKDGSGYFKVNDGTNSYTANVENFVTVSIENSDGEIVVDLNNSNSDDE